MESNKIGAATAFATVLFLIVRSERKQSSYSITFQFLSLSLSHSHYSLWARKVLIWPIPEHTL